MKSCKDIILEDVKRVYELTDLSLFKNKKVLLTGGSGLIGSYFTYLFYYLNEYTNANIGVDIITRNKILKGSKISYVKDSKHFNFISEDLSKYKKYGRFYDFIIHAAGYAAPSVFLNDPVRVIDVNYIGLKSILESMLKVNPDAKILYLSSSEVYGSPTPENFPTPETYAGNSDVTNNRACYIESKRLSEVLALTYINIYKMNIKIARPALSYGPGMSFDDKRVISQFIKKAYFEKEIWMIDDGRDLRCFCYISDVLRQLVNILLFAKENIYNVGSSKEEISIKDLANIIGELMGVKVTPGMSKTKEVVGAPSRVCLDMTKLEKEFGFEPIVRLKDGLKRTIDWSIAYAKEIS